MQQEIKRVNNRNRKVEMIKNQEQERNGTFFFFLLFFILQSRKVDKLKRVLHKNAMKKERSGEKTHGKKKWNCEKFSRT